MIIVGLVTVTTLPIAQFPEITPPTVQVIATYPGADAQTVAETVGVPIEEQVNGVEGMLYMSSNSGSDGSYSLTITFENGTDVDMAAVKVQNRISLAEASLPSSVKQQGVQVMSRSSNIILFIALESTIPGRYDGLFLTNYAKLNLVDELSRIDGVGQVNAFGAGDYSMRIWLNPEEMRVRGVTPDDVRQAISSQNIQVSAGSVGSAPQSGPEAFQFTLTSRGRLKTAEEFGNIIIKTGADNSLLRLKDIARIDLGSQSYGSSSTVSGHQAGLLGVYQLPGANALEVANKVKARLAELEQYFPDGIRANIVLDTTEFVTASIEEVFVTFIETTLIVMVVILLFLQSWRATIIPMLTIPVSLVATFAVMKLLGFTLNTLTLFGLVLAIAIVVDDAIVVVEDCARLVNSGKLTPRQAAEKAMVELQGPVVGEVLVLLSVFIPTAFISGITGELYKQFALTIAVSTAFSGFNALTFTPAMCALFLRPSNPNSRMRRFFIFRWFEKGYGKTLNLYVTNVGFFLKRPLVALGLYAILTVAAFWGFMRWPTSYVPGEDMGYFMTSIQLPEGASFERTDKVVLDYAAKIDSLPEVANVMTISGFSFMAGGAGSNYGSLFVVLKPWAERKKTSEKVFALVNEADVIGQEEQEAIIFSLNPPAIPGLGITSGLGMQLLDINNLGSKEMAQAVDRIKYEAAKDRRLASVTSLYQGGVPQYSLELDRDKIEMMGLTLEGVVSSLSSYMGGSYINDFVEFGRVYQVNMMADARSRAFVNDVMKLTVRNGQGEMVPFSSFAKTKMTFGQSSLSRYNMYNTASITATPAHGVSSSEGIKIMEDLVKKVCGTNYGYAWTGEAYQETQAGTTITMVLIFAIILTILVLAAQYESWTDPMAVILSMPTAILGTIVGCLFMDQSISIYTQIGIILLLGLSAKNAILIVEYARDFRKAGNDIRQAALDAGRIRFRPIMMTALAFVFGVLPMLFASGAGAESRISLGTAVVFGMFVNAIVGTLFVPNFWELMERVREKYLSGLFKSADKIDGAQAPSDDTSKSPSDNTGV